MQVTENAPGPGLEARVIPTVVWYPAGPTASSRSRSADRQAPYPLIVFSQGYKVAVSSYQTLLTGWASAGFVVAAPTYPHTSPDDPQALDESDIVNHPADLRTVLAAVLQASTTAGSSLHGLVNEAEVGLAGHSDGGDVSLAVADNTCCRDGLIKAVAVLSGAELTSFGGQYYDGLPDIPLLTVQGSADTVNLPACSSQLYNAAPSPKYYLDLLGAGHYAPYVGHGIYEQIVAQVTTDFFDAELAHQPAGAAMSRTGTVPGVASWTAGTNAPPAPGNCPGAPG